MSYWSIPDCKRCDGAHDADEPCPGWALRRKLLVSMLDKEWSTLSDDQRLVIGVAGGIPVSLWAHAIALVACNPEAAARIAAKLRAVDSE